jgi:uncharacterized membrane protein (DUF485 family)
MLNQADKQILINEDFRKLVRVRRRISWSFLIFLLTLYLAFGMMSVFTPEVLARPVIEGGMVPLGIWMGYAILAATFTITLVYVWLANHVFSPLERKVIEAVDR